MDSQQLQRELQQLDEQGAARQHPARFRFVQSLSQRLLHSARVAPRQWQRLEKHLATLRNAMASEAASKQPQEHSPSPLKALVEALSQRAPRTVSPSQNGDEFEGLMRRVFGAEHAQRELPALAHLRKSRSEHYIEQQIQRAIDETPEEAGPLNSRRLVTRAVRQLDKTAPHYLRHFAAYIDTLAWLEKQGK
ncbi:conserved hypothetical protein [gamma proteobacterium HTCC5015]|nr:conserved hypothetical protein [gamma proteobacterium HTCC5015]